jgi:hypothetical protein
MMNDELAGDDLLRGGVAFTRSEEMANLLGRIEATLGGIRSDIQASTKAQETTNLEMRQIDRRVVDLESKEDSRKRLSRVAAGVALGLLIPALSAINDAHAWFSTVNATIFPRK